MIKRGMGMGCDRQEMNRVRQGTSGTTGLRTVKLGTWYAAMQGNDETGSREVGGSLRYPSLPTLPPGRTRDRLIASIRRLGKGGRYSRALEGENTSVRKEDSQQAGLWMHIFRDAC